MDILGGYHKIGIYLEVIYAFEGIFLNSRNRMRGYIFGSLKFQINLGCLKLLAFSGVEWQMLDPAYVLRKMILPTPTTTPISQVKKVLTSSWAE